MLWVSQVDIRRAKRIFYLEIDYVSAVMKQDQRIIQQRASNKKGFVIFAICSFQQDLMAMKEMIER